MTTPVECVNNDDPRENDHTMAAALPGSLVVNGTGMGKGALGSPITDCGLFPMAALVWELNYRGKLHFQHQARRQREERALVIEDSWRYFVHGWTSAIEEAFHLALTPGDIEELSEVAARVRS